MSNRHAHLSEEVARALKLEPKPIRWLGIGDNYASDTWVRVGEQRFRVLLPFRPYSQIEVLASDCRGLGLKPCYRNSGNLERAPLLTLEGGVQVAAIVAIPHVHVPEGWWQKETVVEVDGPKHVVLHKVRLWPTRNCRVPILHIDKDEAMAFGGDVTTATMEVHLQYNPSIVVMDMWAQAAKAAAAYY